MNKPPFTELNDLASAQSGGKVLFATDDFFAVAENLLSDGDPIFMPEKYTQFGKWMDGWETRRKRIPGHDWCIIRLGTKGIIQGLDVDTAYFTGNFTPKFSIQAARLTSKDEIAIGERKSVMGSACSKEELDRVSLLKSELWQTLVPVTSLGAGYPETRHNYHLITSEEPWTHIRLNMHPDGGIARLRVYGVAKPDLQNLLGGEIDLMSMTNGAVCQGYSNAHYGHPRNLVKGGRGVNMADGWETARRLDRPQNIEANEDGTLKFKGYEWAIFKLGQLGSINEIIVDTCHFKGNFPDTVRIEGSNIGEDKDWRQDSPREIQWSNVLSPKRLSADTIHEYKSESKDDFTHIKVTIVPDGGISRIKLLGFVTDNRV